MTDPEWSLLRPLVTLPRGRPPADLRRQWDAIFWVACSAGPWKDLPPELGKPDTAHRALRRALDAGLLEHLLMVVTPRPNETGRLAALHAFTWRVARAWRRMSRRLDMRQLLLGKRLGLLSALPCAPCWLPRPDLSETLKSVAPWLRNRRLERSLFPLLGLLHRHIPGDMRKWRLAD